MATSPTGAGPVNAAPRFLMRQIRTGATATQPVAPKTAQSAPAEIDLEGEHPAVSSPSVSAGSGVLPQVDDISIPDARSGAVPRRRFAGLVASKEVDDEEKGPVVIDKPTPSRFGALVSTDPSTPSARQAKINISAVKALTPLVASISFAPGNSAEAPLKSRALANMIVKVQKAASDIVIAMGPSVGNVGWAQGQMMQLLANAASRQWESRGKIDLDPIVMHLIGVLQDPSAELNAALESFSDPDAYIEVDGPDVARARISVSVTGAAWELYDWVTRDSLTMKDQPSRVFSYERPVDEVVDVLLGRILDEARSMQLIVKSTDMQVAHLQGSIRRLAQLSGAEYVTQTRSIMKWIEAPDIDAAERERRHKAAVDQFETGVVRRIMEWVHVNFAGIEHKARKLMESFEHGNNPKDGQSRPAP